MALRENSFGVPRVEKDDAKLPSPNVAGSAPELPLWHLGDVGPLHRRDIYDDIT
jgi:hypothetical protein